MESLEKRIFAEDSKGLQEEPLFGNGFIDSIKKLGYNLILSTEGNVATMKNEFTELRIGYNKKDEVFYFSSYHQKGYLGNSTLMDLFKEEKYEIKKEENKVMIKSKYKDLRINHVRDGERVKIIYSLSAIKSSVMKECLKLAKYYSGNNANLVMVG